MMFAYVFSYAYTFLDPVLRGLQEVSMKQIKLLSRGNPYRSEIRRYSLLLLLPLVLGIALFVGVYLVTTRQVSRVGDMTVRHFEAEASGILRESHLVSDSILGDSAFLENITKPGYEGVDPEELCRALKSHVEKSPFVHSACAVSPSQGHIYTEESYYLYEGSAALLSNILYPNSGVNDAAKPNLEAGWHILEANYAPPYHVAEVPGTDALLIIILETREFLRVFENSDAAFCCMYNEDFSISSLLTSQPGMDWRSEKEVGSLLGRRVRCFYLDHGQFHYLSAVYLREFYAPLLTILLVFAGYFAAVLILGFLYLRIISARRYREVAAMIDGLPQNVSSDSSYEDITAAIGQALQSYRDQTDSQLERQTRENLDLLLSGGYTRSIPDQQLLDAGITPTDLGYYVALFHVKGSRSIVSGSSKTLSVDMTCLILRSALNEIAAERFTAAVTRMDRNYCAVISVLDGQAGPDILHEVLSGMTEIIADKYGYEITAAVSHRVETSAELFSAYKESVNISDFVRAVDSETQIVLQDEITEDTSVLLDGDFLKKLSVLSQTVSMERFSYVPAMVQTILSEHIAGLRGHYPMANDRLSTLASILAESVRYSRFPDDFKLSASLRFRQVTSVSELKTLTGEVFGQMEEMSSAAGSEDVVSRACDYIASHLSDYNLSVPEVAEALEISVTHLSRLFRKKMNITIGEYINTTRIDRAKELLSGTSDTVAKISEQVGYSNTMTFTRNFRRYVNLTPSEFRTLNK